MEKNNDHINQQVPDLKVLALEVLEKGHLLSLGTVDDGGVWVADVNYSFDTELHIYWMSFPTVRHSKAIEANAAVAGAITAHHESGAELAIQLAGKVEIVPSVSDKVVQEYFRKKGKSVPAEQSASTGGRTWYRLKPDFIEVINGRLFGFKKHKIIL